MKRRLTPILTISIAVILIGSLAYAADRRRQTKQVNQSVDPNHEEEVLIKELLQSADDNDKNAPATGNADKDVGSRADKKPDLSKSGK